MTGVEFRALRTSNGLLQRDLAELLGITERQIQRWGFSVKRRVLSCTLDFRLRSSSRALP